MRPVAHFLARPNAKVSGSRGAARGRGEGGAPNLAGPTGAVCPPLGICHLEANAQSFFRFASVGFYLPAAHKCILCPTILCHFLGLQRQDGRKNVQFGIHLPGSR